MQPHCCQTSNETVKRLAVRPRRTRSVRKRTASTARCSLHLCPLWQRELWRAGPYAPLITDASRWLQDTCGTAFTGRRAYEAQRLFSLYLHRSPGAAAFSPDSVFAGRDIKDRCAWSCTLCQPRRCACGAVRLNWDVATLCRPLSNPHTSTSAQLFWYRNHEMVSMRGPDARQSSTSMLASPRLPRNLTSDLSLPRRTAAREPALRAQLPSSAGAPCAPSRLIANYIVTLSRARSLMRQQLLASMGQIARVTRISGSRVSVTH